MLKILIMATASIIIAGLAHHYEIKYSYSDYKDYCNTLLAVSGMVFTIMGIWIAFVYPNAIVRLQDPEKIKTADFSQTMSDTRRLENIVGSVMESAFVATAITIIYLSRMVITNIPFYADNISLIKATALGIVIFLTFVQSSAVFSVIYSNYLFVDDLHTRRETKEREEDF